MAVTRGGRDANKLLANGVLGLGQELKQLANNLRDIALVADLVQHIDSALLHRRVLFSLQVALHESLTPKRMHTWRSFVTVVWWAWTALWVASLRASALRPSNARNRMLGSLGHNERLDSASSRSIKPVAQKLAQLRADLELERCVAEQACHKDFIV